MKVTTSTVLDNLLRLRLYFQRDNAFRNSDNEEPFRSELYSSDMMDRHGEVVARSHKLQKSTTHTHDQLLKRLDDNESTLIEVCNLLVESVRLGKVVTPAAEWLLDNFYLIEEQVTIARKHLPKGYSEGLPCLVDCISEGLPRVYDTVLEIISHSDGRVDEKNISSFIAAYQQYTILTLGELWAIPIMLRIAVIENLRRVSRKIALGRIDQNLADNWAERMTATLKEEPGNLILIIADMARSKPVLTGPFVAALTKDLQGKGPSLALALSWMEQQLSGTGVTSSDLVQQENQKQAADQVSVRNCIGTLRFLGAMDWRVFVEKLSSVEQVLRKDTTGTYPQMDFATRDQYRHVVESISKASPISETEVAQKALELTQKHTELTEKSKRKEHIGYYLIDKGLKHTEQVCGMQYPLKQKLLRFTRRIPVFLYLFSITLITVLVGTWMSYHAYLNSTPNWLLLVFVELLSLSASSRLAVPLVNWFSTIWVHPKLLPRMDFSKGIPSAFRTLVVIPTMLSNKAYIEELVEGLEIRFLANKEVNLHFGLLTDFIDSDTEIKPEDDGLLKLAKARIEALNKKYKQPDQDTFFLFHRPRIWNSREQKWMGYERKRGKLAALNALLRGRGTNEFSLIIGNYQKLTQIKYVITLDSDTQLPRETAWKFIATMAHPLNKAIYNPQKKRVTEGYGILQPRVSSSIPTTANSLYLQMQGDVSGIDPYSRASSDVYQDLFAEGSFIGKGIYDVDIFERALHHIFPENRILSHDLLEGCYTRSGLLSNVLLYEQNPVQYSADVKRHYRWVRGDWQIGAWMLPFVTSSNGSLVKNKLSILSRWKIFDNLRRSLIPQSLVLLLILSWSLLPLPWFWTSMFAAILLLPSLLSACWHLVNKPDELTLKAHLSEVGISVRDILIRFLFDVSVMPFEAYKYMDAVIRTNWRMVFTRKKLLEWTPSAASAPYNNNNVWSAYRAMWINPILVFICISLCAYNNADALVVAAPILVLWLLAPAFAWRLSLPQTEKIHPLPVEQLLFLHQSARKTWSFFEQFVTAAENWLPPDNFQELPVAVIAHRTSPTNIGLALLANLTAYDFGYISSNELAIRCNNTLQTLLKLERYKGHFFNWYDTRSLLPLRPRYVSTVDSGNLTGHLLTLRQGLLDQVNVPIFSECNYNGFRTTARIIQDLSNGHPGVTIKKILLLLKDKPHESYDLNKIKKHLDQLVLLSNDLAVQQAGSGADLYKWCNKLSQQIKSVTDDFIHLVPWLELLPIPEHFDHLMTIDQVPSLLHMQAMPDLYFQHIDYYQQQENSLEENEWLIKLRSFLTKGSNLATERINFLGLLAEQCEQLSAVEYNFLFDKSTNLLSIGYNVEEQRKDDSYYDLLASEARLGIFVAIAQGKLPQESWFALGRLLTNSGGDPILLSWSGSMFEYLMPQLVMPSYRNTLLYQTNKATVKRQIEYAAQRGIPWGISESAYNTVDANLNYQYRAFGVPGLGLKRGLEEDLVIAPYASMLALMVSPAKACDNLQLLSSEGFVGEFGFYEAIDYTASRLPRGKNHSIIQSYMVHHQGMGLLSLAYVLLDKPMQRRFDAELRFQATLLLLQERIPRATLFYAHTADIIETNSDEVNIHIRRVTTANTVIPEIQLLSNGRYQVMITNSGGGYSRWKDIAVTRWREDTTKDNWGIFCYIKDINSGKFWSNTYHPTLHAVKEYEAVFSLGHVEFSRLDYGIETKTEIVISPEDDIEMRRIKITNKTLSTKTLEITSYAEIVMASQASDEAHPAFSNLFVQTEIKPENKAIFCTRRSRTEKEVPPWMFHLMDVHGSAVIETVTYETDRMQFIGRGKTLAHPQAMDDNLLSGSQGSVLDPIMAIRYRIIVRPNHPVTIDLIYGISETKEACENLMHKYQDQHLKKRAFELFWTYSQILLRQINATEADAQLYNRLASSIIYANPDLRAEATVIQSNYRGQSGLWSHSVSGDLPIVLLHIYDPENMELVRQLLQAHAYWRLKGLAVDLIIWNEDHGSYRQNLQEQIQGLIAAEASISPVYNKPGNIFVKSADQISSEDRILFESIARVIISDNNGTLSEQVNKHHTDRILPPLLETEPSIAQRIQRTMTLPDNLQFFNGIGGFTPDGKEYKILTDKKQTTPAPWVNVMANPNFGTVMSESGSAYTWAVNAHEYRITPWSNDPVSDIGGEAYYLRDEETGHFWSPSPFPVRGITPYIITHGFGYTNFEHIEQGVSSEMRVFVDKALPIKFIILKIKNRSGRERKFSATGYLEIILGDTRTKTNMNILSEHDTVNEALLFRNRYNSAFAERVTFFKVEGPNLSYTGDRSEFIGRNRTLEDPQALYRKRLSGRVGAGMDPCAAIQIKFDLLDGAEKEIIFQIGNEENAVAANTLMQKFTDWEAVAGALTTVKEFWIEALGAVQVTTPNDSMNILANGWLTYQTMACRVFARSGFYQSGGAFGFRDQLQDVLALLHTKPALAREQILLSASRQFAEGDVQHWWHPPEGRGVRTHCSDDMLWLPFVVSNYIVTTGDTGILTVPIGFLESRALFQEEESLFDLPISGNLNGLLYEHCARAIRHSFHYGKHGLPLMGSGDWNDGMDQVGNKGQGESVWLAFFLYDVLLRFVSIAKEFGDIVFSETCTAEATKLQTNIEASAWDGEWYLRAWFDDGTPLGSKENEECRIDAIAQSWSVLSGAADGKRRNTAMDSLNKYLVKRDMKLIQLLDPPFNGHGHNPGYIQGYVPGVRENGGQYSHAAIWALMAFATIGDRKKVWELFSMIHPLSHSSNAADMQVYKVEPYVMAADIYANESHRGRGGWTWYTGSSGWMYQFMIGSLIGMKLQTNELKFTPCFPLDWPSVSIAYRFGKTNYKITLFQITGKTESCWKMDGTQGIGNAVKLIDDGLQHEVEMRVGVPEG